MGGGGGCARGRRPSRGQERGASCNWCSCRSVRLRAERMPGMLRAHHPHTALRQQGRTPLPGARLRRKNAPTPPSPPLPSVFLSSSLFSLLHSLTAADSRLGRKAPELHIPQRLWISASNPKKKTFEVSFISTPNSMLGSYLCFPSAAGLIDY